MWYVVYDYCDLLRRLPPTAAMQAQLDLVPPVDKNATVFRGWFNSTCQWDGGTPAVTPRQRDIVNTILAVYAATQNTVAALGHPHSSLYEPLEHPPVMIIAGGAAAFVHAMTQPHDCLDRIRKLWTDGPRDVDVFCYINQGLCFWDPPKTSTMWMARMVKVLQSRLPWDTEIEIQGTDDDDTMFYSQTYLVAIVNLKPVGDVGITVSMIISKEPAGANHDYRANHLLPSFDMEQCRLFLTPLCTKGWGRSSNVPGREPPHGAYWPEISTRGMRVSVGTNWEPRCSPHPGSLVWIRIKDAVATHELFSPDRMLKRYVRYLQRGFKPGDTPLKFLKPAVIDDAKSRVWAARGMEMPYIKDAEKAARLVKLCNQHVAGNVRLAIAYMVLSRGNNTAPFLGHPDPDMAVKTAPAYDADHGSPWKSVKKEGDGGDTEEPTGKRRRAPETPTKPRFKPVTREEKLAWILTSSKCSRGCGLKLNTKGGAFLPTVTAFLGADDAPERVRPAIDSCGTVQRMFETAGT